MNKRHPNEVHLVARVAAANGIRRGHYAVIANLDDNALYVEVNGRGPDGAPKTIRFPYAMLAVARRVPIERAIYQQAPELIVE